MFCQQCGNKLSDDAIFCENCGTKVTENDNEQNIETQDNNTNTAEPQVIAEDIPPAPVTVEENIPPVPVQEKYVYCLNCGSQIPKDEIFCTNCGQAVQKVENTNAEPVMAEEIVPPVPVQEKYVYCSNCGAKIEEGSQFCGSCGQAVNGQPQIMTAEAQNQYSVPPQSSSNTVKKTKRKAPIIITVAAVVVAVIVLVAIIANTTIMPTWEGYASFEDFARAAEINDILSVGALNEKNFYALMGGALTGSILGPFISSFMGAFGVNVSITAKIDLVNSYELSEKYNVPIELRQNYNYLVRRTGKRGSKAYLALLFDSKKVFGVSFPYSGWVVLIYEEGAFIKY